MAKLQGIVIADPAKSNLRFSRIEHDHYDVTRKYPGRPLGKFVSEQDKLNNFDRLMPSPRLADTVKERTVPMSSALNKSMIELTSVRRKNLKADVEIPQLEADKYFRDTDINGGAWFDPKGIYPQSTFKSIDRPVFRNIRNPVSRLINANDYAKEIHYLYVKGDRSFRSCYYTNNSWKDSKTGRVHLFDRPFARIFA
jgi:hypothetical protein